MRNAIKWFGIIVLVAVMGFTMVACPNDDDGGGKNSPKTVKYESTDTAGNTYILIITIDGSTAAKGDSYVLTIKKTGQSDQVSTGTVSNASSGTLTLQPGNSGSDPFTVTVSDGQMTAITGDIAVNGTEEPVASPGTLTPVETGGNGTAPTITTPSLPNGTVGTVYSQTLAATGKTPITWTTESGTLPAGLSLAGTTGVISGTPTEAGTSSFTIKATNVAGNNTKQFSIIIAAEMVQIQGGTFTMGSPETEANRDANETQHQVTLTGFYMGKYPVTQAQYESVMGNNPSYFTPSVSNGASTMNRPVEKVSWYDAIVFCNKLSMNEDLSPAYSISGSTDPAVWGTVPTSSNATWNAVEIVAGSTGYRLPTEAQWEYACRAGTTTAYNTGDTISDNTGWYSSNSSDRTHNVGEKPANAWGLCDMHGNVHEWCWDWNGAYATEAQTDPTGAVSGGYRQVRGGAWVNLGQYLRSARRNNRSPNTNYDNQVGFRLALP
jgi:formylglycine-generating enzyme required for sulfatase activity